MATPPQGDQGPQPGAGGPVGPAQPGAMPGDPNVVLQQLAQAVSMLATATSSQQSQASVKESRFVKAPDVFAPKSLDEELSGWPEWAFCFKNWLSVQDDAFREDLKRVETATSIVAFDSYEAGTKTRAIRLYAILATYLRNRPLRILRSVTDGDGFRVWRALVDELQPSSRPRALALAQALVKFPPFREGGSLLDYTLAFERLLAEYEKVAPHPYSDDLKISTLLAGLPVDIKRYLELSLDESMTYEKLRARLLKYERTTAGWSSEHVLRSVGIDKDSKFLDTSDVVPMDVDRIEKGDKGKKGGRGGKKGDKGWDKGKGKNTWGKNGYNSNKGDKGKAKGYGGKDRGKGKAGGGKKGQEAKGNGKRQVGPCWICHRMGHVAADCRVGGRVQQVSDDASTTVPSSAASTASSSTSPSTTTGRAPKAAPNVRRLEVVPEQPDDINLVIFDPPAVPTCEFFDLGEDDEWFEDDAFDLEVRMVSLSPGNAVEVEAELRSTSTLVFSIADSDDEEPEPEDHVRAVRVQPVEFEQVILDSGADVTVVPMTHSAVGDPGPQTTLIRDAQGNAIPMASQRRNVIFEVVGDGGQRLFFRDKVVVARVKQPLLSLGKLVRDKWCLGEVGGQLRMSKNNTSFPVHMSRNSLAASMKIYRLEQPDEYVRVVVEVSELLESGTEVEGWSLSPEGGPMHVDPSSDCTVDPTPVFPSQQWPFRTTLISRGDRRYEVFESGEFWEDGKVVATGEPKAKIVTILSGEPLSPGDVGKVIYGDQFRPEYILPEEARGSDDVFFEQADPEPAPEASASEVPAQVAAPSGEVRDGGDGPEERGQAVAPDVAVNGQATLTVNGVELSVESSLRVLRSACQFLKLSKSGSKAVLWRRLQAEAAESQLRSSVQASQAVMDAMRREPEVEAASERPDDATVALHEITHCPRQPWCSACVAARSREDNHGPSVPKETGVMHFDFMFNRTEAPQGEPEHSMAVHVVMVDEQTNFVQCVPVESKSLEHVRTAVEEAVKMASSLGHVDLTLKADSEPAMKAFVKAVVDARTRLGLATKVTYAPPDSRLHQGLKAERFIGIIRGLGKTLVKTIEEHTGLQLQSGHPVYVWAFRHAGFLYSRFHVQRDGMTAFELVHNRSYTGKLTQFGSSVLAQYLPISSAKGVSWKRCIFLGKSTLGNLNIVADANGVHHARTMRKGALGFESEAIASAKGVPWNVSLDVLPTKRTRAPRVRAPALVEPEVPGPGPDEAGSDPSSSSLSGGSGDGASMSVGGPPSSIELLPDNAMLDAFVSVVSNGEECFTRRVQEDQPTGHEPEVIPETDFELGDLETAPSESEPVLDDEAQQATKAWADRRYEDGPPNLSPDELAKLDLAMGKLEIKRLQSIGVLRKIGHRADGGESLAAVAGMKRLQSKLVRDWRHRGGVWIRRSRLVAKEFRFLQPELEHLYAPASMAVLQRVFAGLCVSGENLVLYAVDVSDAYLQVRQATPTYVVTDDGEYLELLFTLPGQRDAARGWFMHLKGVMETNRMKSFAGAPAVFYESGKLACNSHVDDLQLVGGDTRAQELLGVMKKT